jgi:hypothetical protein
MSSTRVRISSLGTPSCFRPNATFCSTVMCGNSAYDWNIMFTGRSYGGMSVMSTPSMKSLPLLGSSKPASMRNSVVLPQPEPPSRQNSSFL